MSILAEICARKAEHVETQKAQNPLDVLKNKMLAAPPPAGFLKVLQGDSKPAIIAEIKKASPSKGVIREDFNPVETAQLYQQAGATCISVLTDEPYFQGHDDYLKAVKKAVRLPLLRKDFMIDPYQIYESRCLGADCILLILAALSDDQAAELNSLALELGMDVLPEVHDEEELERALALSPAMIGVNNRNLKTLEVNLETSITLAKKLPDSVFRISESGIATAENIQMLTGCGFDGFLIGESLMRSLESGLILKALKNSEI